MKISLNLQNFPLQTWLIASCWLLHAYGGILPIDYDSLDDEELHVLHGLEIGEISVLGDLVPILSVIYHYCQSVAANWCSLPSQFVNEVQCNE